MIRSNTILYPILLSILFFLSGLISPVDAQSFTVSPTNLNVSYTSGSTSFTITNTGSTVLNWSVSPGGGSWFGVNPTIGVLSPGAHVSPSISYNANPGAARSVTVYVNGQGVTLNQAAHEFTITLTAHAHGRVSPSGIQHVVYGGNLHVDAYADAGYWFHYEVKDGETSYYASGTTYWGDNFRNVTADHSIDYYFWEAAWKKSAGNNTEKVELPKQFSLNQNYPNPFNPTTNINYQIPQNSMVTLKVYDAIGNEVATLQNGVQAAGYYSTKFDGSSLSSGIYFLRMLAVPENGGQQFTQTTKMILLK